MRAVIPIEKKQIPEADFSCKNSLMPIQFLIDSKVINANYLKWIVLIFYPPLILFCSCTEKKSLQSPLFKTLESNTTGIYFSNKLTPTKQFNLFSYMYYYNGAGVGAGDFNNDGLIDLFFSANQGNNKMYLNKGGMKFDDVTVTAGIQQDSGWSTGISVVDINNDGLLDIYICKVGHYKKLKSKNPLQTSN